MDDAHVALIALAVIASVIVLTVFIAAPKRKRERQ